MKAVIAVFAGGTAVMLAGAALAAGFNLDDLPELEPRVTGLAAGIVVAAIVAGSLARIWVGAWPATLVATAASAGAVWLLTREPAYAGIAAVPVFLLTLVLVRSIFGTGRDSD